MLNDDIPRFRNRFRVRRRFALISSTLHQSGTPADLGDTHPPSILNLNVLLPCNSVYFSPDLSKVGQTSITTLSSIHRSNCTRFIVSTIEPINR